MAIIFESTFEDGTDGSWDTETDTQSILTIPHYSILCADPPHQPPFRGAYAVRIDLAGHTGTTETMLQHNALPMAANTNRSFRWYQYVSNLVGMAASDRFALFSIRATATDHVLVEIFNNAGTLELRAGQNGTGGTLRSVPLLQEQWQSIELALLYDGDGADADGTISFYVDGPQVGAQLTGLTQATSTRFTLGTFAGATNVNAGPITSGVILFDQFRIDDVATRVFPFQQRNAGASAPARLTQSGHPALGSGRLRRATLIGSTSGIDGILYIYDTDEANTNANLVVPPLTQEATTDVRSQEAFSGLGYFSRGCYVSLTGAEAEALLEFDEMLLGEELIRDYALRRPPHGVA